MPSGAPGTPTQSADFVAVKLDTHLVAVELAGGAASNRRRLHCVPTTVRRRIVREIAASSHISTRESYLR
jgi:hypothetical protein